ncbi:hypothetical protein RQP46_009500 [Phenoliferia psychrophenolica]
MQTDGWKDHKEACKASNRRETLALIDTGGLEIQLRKWAKAILPEVNAVLNVPHFPELSSSKPSPLTIHIHTSYHPEEKDSRRQFRVEYGEPVTRDVWVASILRKGYILASDSQKAKAGWSNPPPGHLCLLFTTLGKKDGVLPSSRLSQTNFVDSAPPESPSISAIDPFNTGLEWPRHLKSVLELPKSHSVVELETRVMAAFVRDASWRGHAVEVMAGLREDAIEAMGSVELWTMNNLAPLFRANGANVKDAEAVALYSRLGGGMAVEVQRA